MGDSDNVIKLAADNGDHITAGEAGAALYVISLIRKHLDDLERRVELMCIPPDDQETAS